MNIEKWKKNDEFFFRFSITFVFSFYFRFWCNSFEYKNYWCKIEFRIREIEINDDEKHFFSWHWFSIQIFQQQFCHVWKSFFCDIFKEIFFKHDFLIEWKNNHKYFLIFRHDTFDEFLINFSCFHHHFV